MVIYVRSSLIPLTFPHFGLIKTVNNQSLCVRERESTHRQACRLLDEPVEECSHHIAGKLSAHSLIFNKTGEQITFFKKTGKESGKSAFTAKMFADCNVFN